MLGPLLFLIFINDIPLASSLLTWLFADDTVLVESAPNLSILQEKMNAQVDQVHTWLLANKLSVHYVDKSQYMLINSNNHTRIQDGCFELKMSNYPLSRTKTYTYLGIIVDEKFSWADHINFVCMKLSQAAGVIFKVRTLLSRNALMLLYHSLVGQKLRYGLICWATAPNFLLKKINVLHDKIIRYITFSKACSRVWPLYQRLEVQPLNILREVEWGKIMYKYQSNMLPKAFDRYFKKPGHDHATRYARQNNFEQIRTRSAKEKTLIKVIGPKKWSEIPSEIKNVPHLKSFISLYTKHLNDKDDLA